MITRGPACRAIRAVQRVDSRPASKQHGARQDLDRAARGRFAPGEGNRTSVSHTPVVISAEALAASLDHWVNEVSLFSQERAQRQLARGRIVEAHQQRSPQLSLDNLSLTRLPAEIGQLRALESLDVNRNKLAQLPTEIGHLSALKELLVVGN